MAMQSDDTEERGIKGNVSICNFIERFIDCCRGIYIFNLNIPEHFCIFWVS